MGIEGLMEIEVEDNALCKKIKDETYSSVDDNKIFFKK